VLRYCARVIEPDVTRGEHMARVGYARVSTTDQDPSAQIERLKAAGCEIIRSEKVTGTTRKGRSELASVLEFLRRGDELVVTRIDRLARSIGDLQDIVRELKRKDAFLRAADQPIDTSTAAGKAFLDMLGVFAEFETNLRRERQLEGIAKAKAEGVYRGGKRRIDRDAVFKLRDKGKGPTEISETLGISRMHVYRILSERGRRRTAAW
jgi:DNA invertase Pin-like site-specific DNA recombinase